MTILIKNKETLVFDIFNFRCCVGKNGISSNKVEGDKDFLFTFTGSPSLNSISKSDE